MPAAREDYLIRLIQQVSAILRRLRGRLAGGTAGSESSGEDATAVGQEAADAIEMLLGPHASILKQLDATSAVALIGDVDRASLWIGLLRVQAEAAAARGDTQRAEQLSARATSLTEAANARWPTESAERFG